MYRKTITTKGASVTSPLLTRLSRVIMSVTLAFGVSLLGSCYKSAAIDSAANLEEVASNINETSKFLENFKAINKDILNDPDFLTYVQKNWWYSAPGETISTEDLLQQVMIRSYMQEVGRLVHQYVYEKTDGHASDVINGDMHFISSAIRQFPYTVAIDKNGSQSSRFIVDGGKSEQERSAVLMDAVEKYIQGEALTDEEAWMIDNLSAEWFYRDNYISRAIHEVTNKLFDPAYPDKTAATEREQLLKLYYDGDTLGIALEGLWVESYDLVRSAIERRNNEFRSEEATKRMNLLLAIIVLALVTIPSGSFALRRYLQERKIFTTEEKEIIKAFNDLRKQVRQDPAKIAALTTTELQALWDVDNPEKGNISEIQRVLKIIMSKYNEFHLSAIDTIHTGKYYELKKRQDHKKYAGDGGLLQKVLAQHYAVKPQNIMVFDNGSSAAISEIIRFFGKETNILIETPTYGPIYNAAKKVSKKNTLSLLTFEHDKSSRDLAKLEATLQEAKPGLFIMCNPGNPCGQYTPPQEIFALAKKQPKTMFLVDEAYMDFQEVVDDRLVDYTNIPANVICVRTFSKMHGLAGLRVGYALSTQKNIESLKTFPFMRFLVADAELSAAHAIDQYKKYTKTFVAPALMHNREIVAAYRKIFGVHNIFSPGAPNMVLVKLGQLPEQKAHQLDTYLRSIPRVYINFFGKDADFEDNKVGFDDSTYVRISLLDHKTNKIIFRELVKALEVLGIQVNS